MTPAEAQVLLTMCAAFDNRKPDPDAAKAWAAALDGLRFEDCRLAVIAHFRTSTEWLMPAKVRAEVKRIRTKRVNEYGTIPPPPPEIEADPAGYQEWMRATIRAIADGEDVPTPALPAPDPDHARRLAALVRNAPKGVDR